jgi:hypothetical protein
LENNEKVRMCKKCGEIIDKVWGGNKEWLQKTNLWKNCILTK